VIALSDADPASELAESQPRTYLSLITYKGIRDQVLFLKFTQASGQWFSRFKDVILPIIRKHYPHVRKVAPWERGK
jgi:hypothetical protein